MNKALFLKVLVFLILCSATMIVLRYVNPYVTGTVDLIFNIDSESDINQIIDIYYIDNVNTTIINYSEEQKKELEINGDAKQLNSVELPDSVTNIRMDFDPEIRSVKVNELDILSFGKSVINDKNDWYNYEIVNDIMISERFDNSIEIQIDGDDPYISWDVKQWGIADVTNRKKNVINYCIKAIIIIMIWMFFIIFIKYFDLLCEFPIEILNNKTLIVQLSINDFKTRFAGSYLGIIWAFVQPVVTILLYWFVFEKAFHATGVGNIPFALWLTSGLVPWFLFSEALVGGTSSLVQYQYLVKKVVFQIDILPVVKIISSLYVHIFFVLLTIVIFVVSGMNISLYWIQTLYYSFCTIVFTLGLAYITSSITVFFRDLTEIINVFLTVGTWLTPIMWNFETAGLPGFIKVILMANPIFYIVQGYRDSLVNQIWFWQRPALTLYFWMITIIVFCLGTVVYRRLKVHFADIL